MTTKPSLIKLRAIETLLDTVLNGNTYKQAVIPLLYGKVVEVTNNTLTIEHLNQIFKIRTDQPINTNVDNFIDLLRTQINAYVTAGANLFKDLTDINSLATALTTENTFSRSGVTVTIRKVSEAKEDGTPMIMEYKMKTQFLGKNFTTTDEDEVLTFLGSMARQYSINMQRPDPNWYKGADEPKKEVKLKSGGNGGRVAFVGGPRSMGAGMMAALIGGSSIEASESKK